MSDEIEFLRQLRQDLSQVGATAGPSGTRRRTGLRVLAPIVLSAAAVVAVIVVAVVVAGGGQPTRPVSTRPAPSVLPHVHQRLGPSPNLRIGPAPIPRGPELAAVAAVSADDIWAVGDTTTKSFDPTSVALHYDGASWTSVPIPNVGQVRGVAAVSANDVWAVGSTVVHWNGSAWTTVTLPKIAGADFNAISASGPDDVWIVGSRYVKIGPRHDGDATLAEHWDGSSWSVVRTPNPNPRFSDLIDVLTLSPTNAWIVGQAMRGITLHWDGRHWTLVDLPAQLHGRGQMWGIGTDGQGGVWALGDARGTGYGRAIYLHWAGSHWQLVPGRRAGETTTPSAMSGTSASDLWAVGSASGDEYMIARYVGGRWRNVVATTPGVDADKINLGDVVTLAPNDAWAVGGAQDAYQTDSTDHPRKQVVILHWNGTAWTPVAVPGFASVRP